MEQSTRFDVFRHILTALGAPIRPDMKLMELGCGRGKLVEAALAQGFDAYGCDVFHERYASDRHGGSGLPSASPTSEPRLADLKAQGRIRQIRAAPYQLPFADESIDIVISDQVFEHVQDYASVIAELHRVLRPGAHFLHIFPSRYRLIEGHVNVPLASMFRPLWWLWLWAALGIRNGFQRGLPAREVARQNSEYLARGTHYLKPHEIKREFGRFFSEVDFVEREFLPYSGRARTLLKVPFGAASYGLFHSRLVHGVR